MKTLHFCLSFLCLGLSADAQLWTGELNQLEEIPCFGDSSNLIKQPINWSVYQTLENTWNGTIDSSICISVEIGQFNIGFRFTADQIDTSRAIFARYKFDETNKILLDSSQVYTTLSTQFIAGGGVGYGVNCPDDICTGTIIGIQIPNEDTTGFNLRLHTVHSDSLNGSAGTYGCIPTERFSENWLREFILKVTPFEIQGTLSSKYVTFLEANADYPYQFLGYIDSINIENQVGSTNELNLFLSQFQVSGWQYRNLVRYGAWPDQYPNSDNPYFIDANLINNQDSAAIINIHLNYQQSLNFQPFTHFRGGLIEGSDSIRHQLNIINEYGNYCLPYFWDLIFTDNTRYVHQGGALDLQGKYSCLQFRKGGALEIGENQTMYYGQNGIGMLLLRTGGTILLNEKSHLHIDNTLKLKTFEPNLNDLATNQIFMDLPSSAKLSFGEFAEVIVHPGEESFMRLNIKMLGGEIDLSNLDPVSRSYINLIYPEPAIDLSENLFIQPNPSSGQLQIKWIGVMDELVKINLFDMQGRLVRQDEKEIVKGINILDLSYVGLPDGLYLLCLDSPSQGEAVQKLAINR